MSEQPYDTKSTKLLTCSQRPTQRLGQLQRHMYPICTYDTTTRSESKQDRVCSKHHGSKVFRLLIDSLQVDLFTAASGIHGSKLEPDEQTTEREHETEHPEHERGPDGTNPTQNRRWGREYASPDDASDNQKCAGRDAEVATEPSRSAYAEWSLNSKNDRKRRVNRVTFLKRVSAWASVVGGGDHLYRIRLVDIMIGALPVDLGLEKTRRVASRHDGDDREICVA